MRTKLPDRACERKEDFQFLLGRWVAERFLFRLGKSEQPEAFVLKGATLFLIWQGKLLRPTRDIDLLGDARRRTSVHILSGGPAD